MGVKKKMVLIFLCSIVVALVCYLTERQGELKTLQREGVTGNSQKKEVLVTVEGDLEQEPMEIDVEPEQYTAKEAEEAFEKAMEILDQTVLGENQSFDRVEADLHFPKEVENLPISVEWELDSYETLDMDGVIIRENIPKEGALVEIRGILTYGERQAYYIRTACIYPKKKSKKEALVAEISKEVEKAKKESKEKKEIPLPTKVQGKKVLWEYPASHTPLIILLLGVIAALLMPALRKQELAKEQKERKEQMLGDYARIIGDFTLLLDTGMTTKQVWERMVRQYEVKKSTRQRYAYEEMKETYYQMKGGVTEGEAYERFGERCGLAPYRKFGALLSQNLKKGTKGLANLLQMEAITANEEEKARARRKAEEAGTKLLIPMFVMLGVVMAVVIVPAFLSMNV